MERIKPNRKPTLILCSDFHLREDTPVCFVGDFQKEQWDALQFIKDLQKKYECPIIHAGDLFHHWKPSPWLLTMTGQHIPDSFYSIIGQHDLPQHSLELLKKSGIYNLEKNNKLHILPFCHWGQIPEDWKDYEGSINMGSPKILVWHHLTYLTKPFPGATGGNATSILKKYPQYELILTGDNHCSFTVEYQGRRLVNPGNLTRQTADQADFQPRIALWFVEDNSIEWVNLPIQKDVISREHLQVKEQRDARIDAFVCSLNGDYKTEMSFVQNLDAFFGHNQVRESVKSIIYKSIE